MAISQIRKIVIVFRLSRGKHFLGDKGKAGKGVSLFSFRKKLVVE